MTSIELGNGETDLDENEHQICHIPADETEQFGLCGADLSGRIPHSRVACESNPLHSRCVVCLDMAEVKYQEFARKTAKNN